MQRRIATVALRSLFRTRALRPLGSPCAGDPGVGVAGGRGSSAKPGLGALAAAALAAGTALTSVVSLAEARPSEDNWDLNAAINDVWKDLDEQLHRMEAAGRLAGPLPSLKPPEIRTSRSGTRVLFFLPQGLNVHGALQAVRQRLRSSSFQSGRDGSLSSSVAEHSSTNREGSVWKFSRSSVGGDSLRVTVTVPASIAEDAVFEFEGPLTPRDVGLVADAAVASVSPANALSGLQGELESAMAELFEDGLGSMLDAAFVDFLRGGKIGTFGSHGNSDNGSNFESPFPRALPRSRSPHPASTATAASATSLSLQASQQRLTSLGAQVFLPSPSQRVDWGELAGYETQKRAIEDTVLLALLHPEVYDRVARATRAAPAGTRPRAVLFEGPPGTGKTTSARVIASQASVPLVYVPLEVLASKWYGEAEKRLADILEAAEAMPEGCILFLDELDALATSRGGGDMHEATRRVLGVLLRHLQGFEQREKTVVIGATNRKQDLDPALNSRFAATVTFGLPDLECRASILRQYARHLRPEELDRMAAVTDGLSGRDLRDACEQTERKWASKIVRKEVSEDALPGLEDYLASANARVQEIKSAQVRPEWRVGSVV